MIWQQTPVGYAVQVALLGQPFLWMRLYDAELRVQEWFKYLFYVLAAGAMGMVWVTRARIGFFTTALILQYIVYVMGSTYLYNQRYSIKQAVCLGFLTVFLNSYYWELPLHLAEYIQVGFYPAQLVQLWRLTPLLFFIPKRLITGDDYGPLILGALFSLAVMVYRETGHGRDLPLQALHHPFNRVVCLAVLVYVIAGRSRNED